MILVRHYCAALLGALFIHLLGALLLSYSAAGGAADKGELGVEVDLGMLGDLGSAAQTLKSAAVAVPETETLAQNKEVETPPVEQVEQAIAPPVESKQTAEIKVQKKPLKKIVKVGDTPDSVVPIEKIQRPIAKRPSIAEPANAPLAAPNNAQTDTAQGNEVSSLKMSTGSGAALTSGGSSGYKQSYYALIAAKLAKHKRYPQYARNKGQEGTVVISFAVLRSGLVKNIKIKQSSGYRQLDRAVKKMVREASPLPPFPAPQSGEEIIISIPIVFKLNQ